MNNLVIVIIDDESDKRKTLRLLIHRLFPKNRFEIHLCDSVKTGAEAINKYLPDLVFLDIEMPEQSGFDLFQSVDKDTFDLVFTTAFSEYMEESVNEIGCFGYLLKPISLEKLKVIFERFSQSISNKKYLKFVHTTNSRRVLVDLNDILYCKADNNYCELYTKENKYLLTRTLKDIEERLPKNIFIKTHRSFVVNLNQVKAYQRDKSCLLINDDSTDENIVVPVSDSNKSKIENLFL